MLQCFEKPIIVSLSLAEKFQIGLPKNKWQAFSQAEFPNWQTNESMVQDHQGNILANSFIYLAFI